MDIYSQFREFKNIEMRFFNEENELQNVVCSIKSIDNATLTILANNQRNADIFAPVDSEVTLHIYTDTGIYSSASKVISANKGLISTEYTITYPSNTKHSQRREYFRADIVTKFKLVAKNIENPSDVYVVESVTKNICGQGMCYASHKPFFDASSIEVELYFPEYTVKTNAQLVYTKQVTTPDATRFIHAFTFTEISKKDIEFLIKKCFFHQLDLRKRHIEL